MGRIARCVLFSSFFTGSIAWSARAQPNLGSVNGSTKDASGAVAPGANEPRKPMPVEGYNPRVVSFDDHVGGKTAPFGGGFIENTLGSSSFIHMALHGTF